MGQDVINNLPLTKISEAYNVYIPGTEELYPSSQIPFLQSFREQKAFRDQVEIHREDGQIIPLEIWTTPVLNPAQKVIYTITAFVDITEWKQAERLIADYNHTLELQVQERTEALRRSEAQINAFFTSASVGMVFLDQELRYVKINQALANMNGLPFEEYIGKKIPEVLPEFAEKIEPFYQQVIATGEPIFNQEITGELPSQPGLQRYWIASYFPILGIDHQSYGAGSVIIEISDLKKVEAELCRAKEAAEAANRAKSTFLANMSHELRTPLNSILGFTQLMNQNCHIAPQNCENLAIINRSGEHLLHLINDVLDMAKIEAGRITYNESKFSLYRLLNDLEKLFYLKAQEKKIQLNFIQKSYLPELIYSDEVKLRQILINLISNAIKFTEVGSVEVRMEVLELSFPSSSSHTPSLRLYFAVEDTGIGIPEGELESIFEPFLQTRMGKQSQEGTGLGLPISRKFIELMQGKIYLQSEVGIGSKFEFEIQVGIEESIFTRTDESLREELSLNFIPSSLSDEEDRTLHPTDFANLPLALIERLEQATMQASLYEIYTTLDDIRLINPHLAKGIQYWIELFDYSKILAAIEGSKPIRTNTMQE